MPLKPTLIIENRSDVAVTMAYLDRHTMARGSLPIAARQTGTIDGNPSDIAWTNAPDVPHEILPSWLVDAFEAQRGPGGDPWQGLCFRVEMVAAAESEEVSA